jgi:hypothetical protein
VLDHLNAPQAAYDSAITVLPRDHPAPVAPVITFLGAGRDIWNRAIIGALADAGISPAVEGGP